MAPGTYTVSEEGAGGTQLGDYDSSVECTTGEGEGQEVVAENEDGPSVDVEVGSDDVVTCASPTSRS